MVMLEAKNYSWIAFLVQIFVTVSVTVSFITYASSLFHSVSAMVDNLILIGRKNKTPAETQLLSTSRFTSCWSPTLLRTFVGFISFSLSFTVAITQPKSFVKLLDRVVATINGFIFGPVFIVMYVRACRPPFRHLIIPMRTPAGFRSWGASLVAAYFSLCFVLGIYYCVANVAGY